MFRYIDLQDNKEFHQFNQPIMINLLKCISEGTIVNNYQPFY